MKTAIYPGSFDPVTYGHLDIIKRAAEIFDELTVSVLNNKQKTPLFSVEERVNILEKATRNLPNVIVKPFDGLSVNFARENQAQVIVRGLRSVTDYEYEQGQAQIIKSMHPELDTMFLLGKPEYNSYSSSVVREIIRFKGDYSRLVPHEVVEYLNGKILCDGNGFAQLSVI